MQETKTNEPIKCDNCCDGVVTLNAIPTFNPLTFEIEPFKHEFICSKCNGSGYLEQESISQENKE